MPQTSFRASGFTESIIRRMTRIANAHGAINLSQGFPDFEPPAALLFSLSTTAERGQNQYAIT
jgi:aminotransferase